MRLVQSSLAAFIIFASTASYGAPLDDALSTGRQARQKGDFPAAERAFGDATRLDPTNAEAWHMLGLAQAFQRRYDDALGALARAEKLAPADQDIALSVARVHGFAGHYAEAGKRVDAILARQPQSTSAWTLKGRLASYQGQFSAARAAYDSAAQFAPPDVDLLLAYGDLELLQGREPQAQAYFERARALDPQSADVQQRLAPPAAPTALAITPQWVLALLGGKSWLSRTPAPDWTAGEITLSREISDGARLLGGVSYAKRFALEDVMFRVGASGRFSDVWTASLEVGATPNDDVLPEVQAFGSLSARLNDGKSGLGATVAVLDAQLRRYPTGTIRTLSPGLDQYLADGRIALSVRAANTWDATDKHLLGWSAAAFWQASDQFSLRVGIGNAPEAERGLVADTKSLTGGIGIRLTDTLLWRVDITQERRQASYRRVELLTGFSYQF